jgi:hypothetical protein
VDKMMRRADKKRLYKTKKKEDRIEVHPSLQKLFESTTIRGGNASTLVKKMKKRKGQAPKKRLNKTVS